jgi:transposase InsO family protein
MLQKERRMSEEQRAVETDVGPGGGERSEPEPGPTTRGRPGPRPGQTLRRYTPEERRAALEALVKSGLSYEGFARIWGVSRHTIYIWMKRYREHGPQGLDHPCGDGRPGRKPLAAPVREEILLVQRRFPDFGLRRVRDWLARFRGVKVSAYGVRSAIEAAGIPRAQIPRRVRRREVLRRFERSRPGELWQSDITSMVLARPGKRVQLVVFMDDFSRYVVSWSLDFTMTAAVVGEALLEGASRFGKPLEVLTDQGPQYFAWRGKCGFQKLLDREGIDHVVARTHHPQTLGKCERLWKTVKEQLWDRTRPRDIAEARERLAHFFRHYNHFRPHQGIGGLVPADRFFGAETAARAAIESAMEKNELLLALGERPRTSVFLFGQIGDEQVSLHGERGRLVVQTPQGTQEVDIEELGTQREERDDAHDADGGDGRDAHGDDDGGDDAGAGERDAHAAGPGPSAAGVSAAGVSDPGAVGGGLRGGASTGACAVCDAPRVLAGRGEQAGGGAASERAVDPRVADESAGGGGDGVRTLEAAERQERQARDGTGRGRQGPEEGERAAREGERALAGPGVGPAADAGQQGPRDPGAARGGGEGGRGGPAPEEEKQARAPVCARCCGSGSAADPLSTASRDSSRSSPA